MISKENTEEYLRCLNDSEYVISKYLKIYNNIIGGYVPFNLLNNQKLIIDGYKSNKFNITKKYRQGGVTSITNAYLATKLAFIEPNKPECIVLCGHNFNSSKISLTKIKEFLNQIPSWVWGDDVSESDDFLVVNTKKTIVLPNGSMVMAITGNEDDFIGYNPTYVVFDEMAYMYKQNINYEFIESLSIVTSNIIISSTPNSEDELFNKIYMNSILGLNQFNIMNINWWEDERYNKDIEWVLEKDGEVLDLVIDVPTNNSNKMILLGYKPRNLWYETMRSTISNPSRLDKEIDANFIF